MTDTNVVVFRKFKDGEVLALFPDLEYNRGQYQFVSYMHVGQHGSATTFITSVTYPATPEEYAPLKAELERIGYMLKVKNRINRSDLFYAKAA